MEHRQPGDHAAAFKYLKAGSKSTGDLRFNVYTPGGGSSPSPVQKAPFRVNENSGPKVTVQLMKQMPDNEETLGPFVLHFASTSGSRKPQNRHRATHRKPVRPKVTCNKPKLPNTLNKDDLQQLSSRSCKTMPSSPGPQLQPPSA